MGEKKKTRCGSKFDSEFYAALNLDAGEPISKPVDLESDTQDAMSSDKNQGFCDKYKGAINDMDDDARTAINNKEMGEKKNKRSNREKKTRCTFCKKKTGLISFTCDCEGVFCAKHLNAHSHECCLIEKRKDEKKKELEENNPKIDTKKVEKI